MFEIAKELVREGNILAHGGKIETPLDKLKFFWDTLIILGKALGLKATPEEKIEATQNNLSDAQIEAMIEQRAAARKAKNFAEGDWALAKRAVASPTLRDRLRNELQEKGITLIDQAGGSTIWHRS